MAPNIRRRNPSQPPHKNLQPLSGLYQHISPPRAVPALNPASVRAWLQTGDVGRLQQLVLDGQGHRLLGEKPPQPAARAFIRALPGLMARQEAAHIAADEGRLEEVQAMLGAGEEGARLALSKDQSGLGLLHKVILRGHVALARFLIQTYPATVALRDYEGRTALHYCGASPDPIRAWAMLEEAGADADVVDRRGNRARHYMNLTSKNTTHASHGHAGGGQPPSAPSVPSAPSTRSNSSENAVSRAHIRKWIHERDVGRLEQLVWAGHGERLLPETSASPRVRRFLDAVPFIMSVVKEAHTAAINNNVPLWSMRTSSPVPDHVMLSKDKNGLTPLHKTSGLGHLEIVQDILHRSPQATKITDNDGRLPVHYAASKKELSDIYKLLIDAGSDDIQIDNKGHTASYYAQHSAELDLAQLSIIPDAPRAPSTLPTSWNWDMLSLSPTDALMHQPTAPQSTITVPKAQISYPKKLPGNISKQNVSNNTVAQNSSLPTKETKVAPKGAKLNATKASLPSLEPDNDAQNNSNLNNLHATFVKKPKLTNNHGETKKNKTPLISSMSVPQLLKSPEKSQTSKHRKLVSTISESQISVDPSNSIVLKATSKVLPGIPIKGPQTASKTTPGTQEEDNFQPDLSKQPTDIVEDNSPGDFPTSPSKVQEKITPISPTKEPHISPIKPPPTAPTKAPPTAPTQADDSSHTGPLPIHSDDVADMAQEDEQNNSSSNEDDRITPEDDLRPISPPGSKMTAPLLERWVKAGDLTRLEDALLEGKGSKVMQLLGNAARSKKFRDFVQRAPSFMELMGRIHSAAQSGDLDSMQELTDSYRRLVLARDDEGALPMHRAAQAGHESIVAHIMDIFPAGVATPDWEGRTPLHYAAMCKDRDRAMQCYQLLLVRGAPESALDSKGNKAAYYLRGYRDHHQNNNPEQLSTSRLTTGSSGAGNLGETRRNMKLPVPDESEAEGIDEEEEAEEDQNSAEEEEENKMQTLDESRASQNGTTKPLDYNDEEAMRLVQLEDTEKLADMVLNGEGERLVGLTSTNPYVQGFLKNVPAYMEKIRLVHEAAANGDVITLQAALERRKFVCSRDQYGATPLHKGVLFGHRGVTRYLGSRFSEALQAQDKAGRSPLHYAAVLPDRGQLYRTLLALGADPNIRDMRGHTARDYQLHHEQRKNHEQLLGELGADPKVATSLAKRVDDGTKSSSDEKEGGREEPQSRRDVTYAKPEPGQPIQWTEEGQYLATSLGDPLIKGLMEVSNTRPRDPIGFLATYLYNFANSLHHRSNTQESSVLVTGSPAGEENLASMPSPSVMNGPARRLETAGSMTSAAGSTNRDEHGQSMLHFAAARSHSRNAFFQLLREAGLSVGQRDALYRTPRDVALEAGLPQNAKDIDSWVMHLALEGDTERLEELLLDGYDHILDVKDADGNGIEDVIRRRNVPQSLAFLKAIPSFEGKREWVHKAIRMGSLEHVREILTTSRLAVARNLQGRSSLHVAVLCQNEPIVEYIASKFPITLGAGDNLERTALHYAMGMDKVETLSQLLTKAGARRVLKDLKGRQASYYFVNRDDILKLRDEELQERT